MRKLLACVLALGALAAFPIAASAKTVGHGHRAHLRPAREALPNGVKLPASGTGYEIPETWEERGLSWGTPELVGLLKRVAARVAKEQPGAVLYIADLSPKGGGASSWHRSHRTGRDADLIYFAVDDDGNSAAPPHAMHSFDEDGVADVGEARVYFDLPRNWALVRALLQDPSVHVSHLFIATPLRARLLAYARKIGEPERLLARAAETLHQPSDSTAHDDHMHVRIDGMARLFARPSLDRAHTSHSTRSRRHR